MGFLIYISSTKEIQEQLNCIHLSRRQKNFFIRFAEDSKQVCNIYKWLAAEDEFLNIVKFLEMGESATKICERKNRFC